MKPQKTAENGDSAFRRVVDYFLQNQKPKGDRGLSEHSKFRADSSASSTKPRKRKPVSRKPSTKAKKRDL
jgi:hypothetical protein